MPRLYHSASSILAARNGDECCDYAWALRYIAGVRDVEVDYADIESGRVKVLPRDVPVPKGSRVLCSPRQKSKALGKALHKVGEDWYSKRAVNWGTFPAQIFVSGSHLLPAPDGCDTIEVEQSIGRLPSGATDDYAPKTCLDIHGIRFAGNRDLLVEPGPAERARLDLPRLPGGYLQVDYKSTASIGDYAKSAVELRVDLQAAIYTVDFCLRYLQNRCASRWVYFETKSVRRAIPVDFTLDLSEALDVVGRYIETARRVDLIGRLEDAEKNPRHCGAYAGCPHHVSAGGACNARRSLGALVQIDARKKGNMALTPEQLAKFEAFKKKPAAVETVAEAPEEAEIKQPATQAAQAAQAPSPKTRAPRKPKAAPEPVAIDVTEPLDEVASFEGEADAVEAICAAKEPEAATLPVQVLKSRTQYILGLAKKLSVAQEVVDSILAELREACK